MAVFVATATHLTLNSVDLTCWITNAELSLDVDPQDSTDMCSTGWKETIAGLKGGSLKVTFNQDYAASAVDASIWAAFGTVVTFTIRPVSPAVSSTNPNYAGSVLINQYPAVSGTVGQISKVSVTWPTSGAISRATS